jgi:N-acetylmuramic acid 6-phosphate etherase
MNKDNFLKLANEFKLGMLTTESMHPVTTQLSHLVQDNLPAAIESLKQVDVLALSRLENYLEDIFQIHLACQETLRKGRKVFLCGCGATGRLSLTLETLYRQITDEHNVISFMAGGDYALIKSVESFEDRMSYGSRQLKELGFMQGDLLLAITEGGETSFVIGAALEASKLSRNHPFFLYCNPDEELIHLERCRDVLENKEIRKCLLNVGPMALSGSTRMQATTVQMFAAGMALLTPLTDFEDFKNKCQQELESLKNLDYRSLVGFIEWESQIYQTDGIVTYSTPAELAITILTDTTERSPTFSLIPFETNEENHLSLCHLCIQGTSNATGAWKEMLGRAPRGLHWGSLEKNVGLDDIYKFDISEKCSERRSRQHTNHFQVNINSNGKGQMGIQASDNLYYFDLLSGHILTNHLAIKMLLNTHSTLVMGKLDRYQSNMMTWVRPSNYKLIDRAARYVIALAKQNNIQLDYEKVIDTIFSLENMASDKRPIVLAVLHELTR